MTTPLLDIQNLRCERDDRILFEGLDWTILPGDIVQVRGPNGSGKTSLLRILLGLNPEYSGDILFKGEPLNKNELVFRQQLLFIGHLPAVNRSLTPIENLRWFTQLHAVQDEPSLEGALKSVGLRGFEDTPGHHLSAGQHRRVALARLYLSSAKLWVLDEPFTAIDVQGVDNLREKLNHHTASGGSVIITTHQDLGLHQVKVLDLADYKPVSKRNAA